MNRRALIISNPGEKGDRNYFEKINIDVDKSEGFLLSPEGGCWYKEEIKRLYKPTVGDVQDAISDLKKCDYSLVIFTGHGWYSSDADSTILQLRENQEIDSVKLLEEDSESKRTVIIDCCREIYSGTVLTEARKMEFAAKRTLNPDRCRRLYDKEISEAGSGFVMTFSCRSGEKSYGNDEFGSFYIHNLIRAAERWADSKSLEEGYYYSKSISQIHELAREGTLRMSSNRQTPRISQSKDGNSFPFCIVA